MLQASCIMSWPVALKVRGQAGTGSCVIYSIRGFRKFKGAFHVTHRVTSERCRSPRGHEASTGVSPSYPSFLQRNPPKHPLSSTGGSLKMKSVSKKQGFVKCKALTLLLIGSSCREPFFLLNSQFRNRRLNPGIIKWIFHLH